MRPAGGSGAPTAAVDSVIWPNVAKGPPVGLP
jgi:hypothetical protein